MSLRQKSTQEGYLRVCDFALTKSGVWEEGSQQGVQSPEGGQAWEGVMKVKKKSDSLDEGKFCLRHVRLKVP
jgi:hypothetical protein